MRILGVAAPQRLGGAFASKSYVHLPQSAVPLADYYAFRTAIHQWTGSRSARTYLQRTLGDGESSRLYQELVKQRGTIDTGLKRDGNFR